MASKDIRLLTLYKQHYLDKHPKRLEKGISCFGYYDEITIESLSDDKTIEPVKSDFDANAPVTIFWYGTNKQLKGLNGGYSNQNIGIFRCNPEQIFIDHQTWYWDNESKLPFFGLGFIKLTGNIPPTELIRELEAQHYNTPKEDNVLCNILFYCTYDNADLVLLVKSNKLTSIENLLSSVEQNDNIGYLHSIIGIDENYLHDCNQTATILDIWNGNKVFTDESLKKINIQLVTSGAKSVLNYIKDQWDKSARQNFDHVVYTHLIGHGNTCITIKNTNAAGLISLILPNGFITHANDAYNYGLYNIETSFTFRENDWDAITAVTTEKDNSDDSPATNWCQKRIKYYADRLQNKSLSGQSDEGLDGYYRALIQTLNSLDQYERFSMSRDIFLLLYPSFSMFDAQLKKALTVLDRSSNNLNRATVKNALRDYLEYANSVMYHTVHTDQIYLMIPGYSGTSFSIPIKLNLFYLWFTQQVTDVLNDATGNCRWILTPVTETKPETKQIIIDNENQDRLICVKLSQRQLFFPKNLMIILTHELAHYLGLETRCREIRMKMLLRTYAYYLAEIFVPDFPNNIPNYIIMKYKDLINQIKWSLQKEILCSLMEQTQNSDMASTYYVDDISEPLETFGLNILSDLGQGNRMTKLIIRELNAYIEKEFPRNAVDDKVYQETVREIYEIQKGISYNRKKILPSGLLKHALADLFWIYRETYSDIVSFVMLQCSYEDYAESFRISEGLNKNQTQTLRHCYRMHIIKKVFAINDSSTENATPSHIGGKKISSLTEYLSNNIFRFQWLLYDLNEYAKSCRLELEKRINQTCQDRSETIRKRYQIFANSSLTCGAIYNEILDSISDYKNTINCQYESDLEKELQEPSSS